MNNSNNKGTGEQNPYIFLKREYFVGILKCTESGGQSYLVKT